MGGRTPTQAEISGSRAYYPAVGLLLGLVLVGVERGAREAFPEYLTAALLLAVLVVVNRGLHLDGPDGHLRRPPGWQHAGTPAGDHAGPPGWGLRRGRCGLRPALEIRGVGFPADI